MSEKVFDVVFCAESATVTTTLKVPDAVDIPVIMPALDRLNPGGIDEPLAAAHDQLNPVPVPPVADRVVSGYAVYG